MTRRDALSAAAIVIVLAGLPSGCRPPAVRLQPPDEVRSLEGYASLRLSGEGSAAKSRVSFLVRPPDRARVEVIDVLGRVVLFFVLNGPGALLVVPAERVYCEADSGEVTARFLGFALSPEEMAAVLSGVWPGAPPGGGGPLGWRLERDARNRVRRGSRGGAYFEVAEFFEASPCPRRLDFGSERGGGRLTVLRLGFNSPLGDEAFPASPPGSYRARTWEEIEELFRHED